MKIAVIETAHGPVYVRLYAMGEVMLTGVGETAAILQLNPNTIRRYIDDRHIDSARLPSGQRRPYLNSVLELHHQFFGKEASVEVLQENN